MFKIHFMNIISIPKMIDSYERLEKIGEGTYGIVYKARHRETNKIVALKKVRIENENEGIPPTTIREISLLKSLDHPNIIKLLDVLNADNKLYIVFEFLETDLRKFIDEATYGASVVKKIVYQLFLALNYIHARGILHRDIKPQNILVDKNLNIRLADFGISRCINVPLRTYTDNIITLWYRPPELILGVKYYSCQVDVWGVGCIMAELVAKKVLFPGDSEIDQLYRIFRIRGTPNEKVWKNVTRLPNWKEEFPYWEAMGLEDIIDAEPEYINLMEKCLTYDPIKRATPKKALEHAFFK